MKISMPSTRLTFALIVLLAISAGVAEGLNNKAKLTTRKAYGFSTFKMLEIALYHTLGDLPEPEFTHRFF